MRDGLVLQTVSTSLKAQVRSALKYHFSEQDFETSESSSGGEEEVKKNVGAAAAQQN